MTRRALRVFAFAAFAALAACANKAPEYVERSVEELYNEAMDKLQAAASQALKQPEVKAQIAKLELEVVDQPGADASRDLAQQSKLFAEIGKQIGLKPE